MMYLDYNNKLIDIPIQRGDEVYSNNYGQGTIKSVIYEPINNDSIISGFKVSFDIGTVIVNRVDVTVLKTEIF